MNKVPKFENRTKYFLVIIRFFIIIFLFSRMLKLYDSTKFVSFPFLALALILITHDAIRNLIKKNKNKWYYLSLTLSIIGATAFNFFINSFETNIYLYIYVIEIFYLQGKDRYFLLALHCILYLSTVILNTTAPNIVTALEVVGSSFLSYLSILCILYLSHAVRYEREETKKLNEELRSSNIKLQEYSIKVEGLTIAKERQRMAQELHDSLGHSLMALTMHLEFAEKIIDTHPEKVKEVILKAKKIAKNSTAGLRMAVDTLKEERNIEDLNQAILGLINSFEILGNIKIDFRMDNLIEDLNPDIKVCLYKTIRESLTNALKHGNATVINLEIGILENHLSLVIKDNGIGCNSILRSDGIKGIEDRISALGGTISFTSSYNSGFLTKATIPIY